ncbi:MAG: hypothetical protein RSF68_14520 [Myroides sp.]
MLKGKSVIELRNAETGKIEQVIEDENMVTNAVSNLMNVPNIFGKYEEDSIVNPIKVLSPIYKNCFGGLLLFEKNIQENVNAIFPPLDNVNVAHAAGGYSGLDKTRGTLNVSESKEINGGKGYRFVWDFATDRANGTIRCVSLTSYSGGTIGLNSENINNDDGDKCDLVTAYSSGEPLSKPVCNRVLSSGLRAYRTKMYPDRDYITFIGSLPSNKLLFSINKQGSSGGKSSLDILVTTIDPQIHLLNSVSKKEEIKTINSTKKFTKNSHINLINNEIQSVYVTGINTFDLVTIAPNDLIIKQEVSFSVQDAKFETANYEGSCLFNGYFYISGSERGTFYKIKYEDLSNYTLIKMDSPQYLSPNVVCGLLMFSCGTSANTDYPSYIYNNGNTCKTRIPRGSSSDSSLSMKFYSDDRIKPPYVLGGYSQAGDWGGNGNAEVMVGVFAPYLGTINNLTTPVVKNETQTMKVTYEITEV